MSQERFDAIMNLLFEVVLAIAIAILFSSGACTSVGRCVFPPHVDPCDPGDFDPKCLVGRCADVDAGPR